MKVFVFFFVLAIGGAAAKPQGDAAEGAEGCSSSPGCEDADGSTLPGYTYVIKATRSSQIIPSGMPVLYMYYQIAANQNLTYFKTIDDDNPLSIEMYLFSDDTHLEYFAGGDATINVCDEIKNDSWDYVAIMMVTNSLLPDRKCPVHPGNYEAPEKLDPITVTFPTKIPCDTYTLTLNLNRVEEWAGQFEFSFEIADNDDTPCIS